MASTEAAIVDVLVRKSLVALARTGLQRLVVAGGVGANRLLRAQLDAACPLRGVRVHYPELDLCTDNGAMIAWTGIERLLLGLTDEMDFPARPRWPLDQNAERVHNGKA